MQLPNYLISITFICFSILVLGIPDALAQTEQKQEKGTYLIIETKDDNKFIGKKLQVTEEYYLIVTESVGEIKILKENVEKIKEVPAISIKDGKYWHENSNATRNLYGPTGYGLKKGEGYYQNFMLVLNSVNYGFTNHFTIGAGVIPIPLDDGIPFVVTPKFSFPIIKDKFNIGAGLLVGYIGEWLGIGYGVATYGSRDNNLTLGVGYGWTEGELADRPIITASGQIRVGRKFGLITENWIVPNSYEEGYYDDNKMEYIYTGTKYEYFGIFTYGVRYLGEKISIDFAFINSGDFSDFSPLGIPLVGVVIPFKAKSR